MSDTHRSTARQTGLKRYTWFLIGAWTLVVAGLFAWEVRAGRQVTEQLALNEGRAHFDQDQAFRFWATSHGGVYVSTDDRTPPSPYLSHVPERDIETPSGRKLTLMNPAYALRQMNEDFAELFGVPGHITSLKPLRPENAPDEWERSALEAFEQGETEVSEFTQIHDEPYLRLMRPMVTQEGCLKCHAHQGYQVGDVRGGVSVSVPLSAYLAEEQQTITTNALSLGLLWLIGLAVIGLGSRGLRGSIRTRDRAQAALQQAELRFRTVADFAYDWEYWENPDGTLRYASPACERITGYAADQFVANPSLLQEIVLPEDREILTQHCHYAIETPGLGEIQFRILRRDGETVWIEHTCRPVVDEQGTFLGHRASNRDITDHKRAVEALAEERNLLRTLIDALPDHIYVKDTKGRMVLVNLAQLAMFGKTDPDEVIGKTDLDLGPAEFAEQYHRHDLTVMDSGEPLHVEETFMGSEGELRWVSSIKVPWRDVHGDVTGVVGMSRDITDRKEMERALAEERNLLRTLIDAVPDHIYVKDTEGQLMLVNRAQAQNLMGLDDPEKGVGMKAAEFTLPELLDIYSLFSTPERFLLTDGALGWPQSPNILKRRLRATHQAFEQASQAPKWVLCAGQGNRISPSVESGYSQKDLMVIESGKPLHAEEPVIYLNGEHHWMWSVKVPLHDNQGEVIGMVGMSHNITHRKEMEESLREREAALAEERNLLRTLIDTVPDHVFVKDAEGRVLLANVAQVRSLGLTGAEDLVGKTDFDLNPAELAEQYYENDMRVIQSGQPLQIEEPFVMPTGEERWGWTIKVPLRNVHGEIIGVIGMSRDITDRKRAEEQIRASLREKEVLLQEIHHRVKNNLAIVSSLLEWQAEAVEGQQARAAFQNSQHRIRTMARVHEHLYLSQDLAHVDMAEYIRALTDYLSESYGAYDIAFKVDVVGVALDADTATPCGLIINELVSNALKYAFPPGVERRAGRADAVCIALRLHNGEVELTVSDNGVGLPGDLDIETVGSMGLNLVRLLAQQLEGRLEVDRGEGTTFRLTFPAPREGS